MLAEVNQRSMSVLCIPTTQRLVTGKQKTATEAYPDDDHVTLILAVITADIRNRERRACALPAFPHIYYALTRSSAPVRRTLRLRTGICPHDRARVEISVIVIGD